jgi:hypothetical protein
MNWMLMLIIIAISLTLLLAIKIESEKQAAEICDSKYGKGNWVWMVEPLPYSYGIRYKCVP